MISQHNYPHIYVQLKQLSYIITLYRKLNLRCKSFRKKEKKTRISLSSWRIHIALNYHHMLSTIVPKSKTIFFTFNDLHNFFSLLINNIIFILLLHQIINLFKILHCISLFILYYYFWLRFYFNVIKERLKSNTTIILSKELKLLAKQIIYVRAHDIWTIW